MATIIVRFTTVTLYVEQQCRSYRLFTARGWLGPGREWGEIGRGWEWFLAKLLCGKILPKYSIHALFYTTTPFMLFNIGKQSTSNMGAGLSVSGSRQTLKQITYKYLDLYQVCYLKEQNL